MDQRQLSIVTSPLWLFFSRLEVPPKIRIFCWRLAHEALSVCQRLKLVGLSDEHSLMCGVATETCLHTIRDCPDMVQILQSTSIIGFKAGANVSSCVEWLDTLRTIMSLDAFRLILVVYIFHGTVATYAAVGLSGLSISSSGSSFESWSKPPEYVLKVNVDAMQLLLSRMADKRSFSHNIWPPTCLLLVSILPPLDKFSAITKATELLVFDAPKALLPIL
ncbi:hypothetical protein F3Y22_tig00110332pilonHSYRG01231 [Hibiscus syriacus]|uniref:Reverse transcriptase zinc-binding domain-containing protein n=1 Tax=Hibiscus syriacus TaxID=106335 RepID=A0A6A3AWZ3_HIBSY|nr:hypothetical protein F3Y22_tig00110332pilonHSYRG01231 [Hibiscus syriacus]